MEGQVTTLGRGGSDVVMMHDFLKGQSYDLISQLRYDINLPKSNVLQFVTANGSIISARPSGTEPKIKFYFSVRTRVESKSQLEQAEMELDERIKQLVSGMKLEN
jgi:phosphoglucomutase